MGSGGGKMFRTQSASQLLLRFLVLLALGTTVAACATPQVVEKVVEKPVVETVIVEKEKVVEKPVVETVIVEKEKIVEKPVVETVIVEVEKEIAEKPTGTVIIGHEGDPERMVTTIWTVATNTPIHQLLYDSLVSMSPQMTLEPRLAESFEYSEDGRTLTFHLRKDVRFHDGTPLTAHDVSFTYHLCAAPGVSTGETSYVRHLEGYQEYRDGPADSISGIKVLDDYTIGFTTPEPYAPGLVRMTKGIMPKHILEDVPPEDLGVHEFNYHPIGSGPFKLVEYVPDRHVILEANENYFLGSPKLGRVIFRIASHEALLASWLRQELDAAPVPVSELAAVEDAGFGYIHEFSSSRINYIGPNCQGVFFEDARVRRAISLALDRQMLVDVVLGGNGWPLTVPHLPDTWAYDTSIIPDAQRDLEAAAALLDEAGWKLNPSTGTREKDGVPFEAEFWYVTDREVFQADLAALLQVQLAEVGLSIKLRAFDSPSIWPILLPRDGVPDPDDFYDFGLFGTTLGQGDPSWMWGYIHGDAFPPTSGNNQLYDNPTMNDMLDKEATIMDPEERAAYWHDEIWPFYLEEQPMIGVLVPKMYWAINYRFRGFNPQVNSRVNNPLDWSVQE
jgi:peptide/nickel transport system substrate-binding protein